MLERLYEPMREAGVRIIRTDPRTAELSKLASNAFLASKISFANAMARVSELAGADVDGVTEIHGRGSEDRRGTSCGPGSATAGTACRRTSDPRAGRRATPATTSSCSTAVIEVNELQKRRVDREAARRHLGSLAGKRIALLGLAFKPNTDDMREASSVVLAARARRARARVVRAYDPVAEDRAARACSPRVELLRLGDGRCRRAPTPS